MVFVILRCREQVIESFPWQFKPHLFLYKFCKYSLKCFFHPLTNIENLTKCSFPHLTLSISFLCLLRGSSLRHHLKLFDHTQHFCILDETYRIKKVWSPIRWQRKKNPVSISSDLVVYQWKVNLEGVSISLNILKISQYLVT